MYSKFDPTPCASCNSLHTCTGTPHCPCFDLPVPEEILEYIASRYDECLCNECINKLKVKYIASLFP